MMWPAWGKNRKPPLQRSPPLVIWTKINIAGLECLGIFKGGMLPPVAAVLRKREPTCDF